MRMRSSEKVDGIVTQESLKMNSKLSKYLSESFSRDASGDSGWGKKYCTTTGKKRQQRGRKKRRDRFHVARKTRGKAEREVCERTARLCQRCMPSYSPAHFCPAAKRARKMEREVTTAWERKRKQGGDFCDHLAARSLASSVVVGLAASPPCLIPLWVLARNAKHHHLARAWRRGVELGPKPSEISKSQPIPQEHAVAQSSDRKCWYQVHVLTQGAKSHRRSDTRPERKS